MNIKEVIKNSEYDFLRENKHLGKNIMFLTIGGSYAYGMNNENSDIDIRGIAFNSPEEILTYKDFEQVVEINTDTTIYSINKILTLLTSCNPNTIEMLGNKPENYIFNYDMSGVLIKNRKLFLSKLAINTFGGYANAQLRRLENKAARKATQEQQEQHILNTINNAKYELDTRHQKTNINLYIDKAVNSDLDKEIFFDADFKHYSLRDWTGLWNELKAIVSSYEKYGKRNLQAVTHDKIGKHMAHLIRLYLMGIDILEKEEVITYREAEHDLLMDIKNGKFLDENQQPTADFYDLLNDFEKRFEYAKNNTNLPDVPNYKAIEELRFDLNRCVILNCLI